MKLSFSTLGCPEWTLRQVVDNAVRMGFDGVELRGVAGEHVGCDEPAESRRDIRRMFEQAHVKIPCISAYSCFTFPDAMKRREQVEATIKMLAVAGDIGCPALRLFCGGFQAGGYEENLSRVVESLRLITPEAERLQIKLAMETHDDWCRGVDLRTIIDTVASPAVGVCWDIANASFFEPMERTFAAIKDRLFHVHFKDAMRLNRETFPPQLPGQGEVDMAGGLAILQRAGYGGWLSFEWEKKWFPTLEAPEVAFPYFHRHTTELMTRLNIRRG